LYHSPPRTDNDAAENPLEDYKEPTRLATDLRLSLFLACAEIPLRLLAHALKTPIDEQVCDALTRSPIPMLLTGLILLGLVLICL